MHIVAVILLVLSIAFFIYGAVIQIGNFIIEITQRGEGHGKIAFAFTVIWVLGYILHSIT